MTMPIDPNQPQPGWGPPPPGVPSSGTNGMAIILSFLCWPLGLIFAFVAKSQIKKRPQSGDGLATAAIIICGVWIVVFVIAVATGHGSFSFHVGSDGSDG